MPNQTFTYQTTAAGSTSEFDWSASSNWVGGTVPSSSSDVPIIGAGPAGAISVDNLNGLTLSALEIAAGATVAINPGNTLTILGSLQQVPNLGSGQLAMSGTNTSLVIGASAPFANKVGISLSGSSESITLTNAGNTSDQGSVSGFGVGDTIDLPLFTSLAAPVLNGSTLVLSGTYSYPGYPGTTGTITFTNFSTVAGTSLTTASDGHGGFMLDGVTSVCYAAGTHLLTPTGERLVEDLREDDLIVTLHGEDRIPRVITWVGRMRVNLARHPRPETAAPIRIRRGAFADNVPHRDLLVSPEHCVFVDGRLVAAKCLVNGATIVQDLDRPAVAYFHIETAPHSIVLAEGLPAETYLDTGNRAFFDNAGPALLLHPEFHVNAGLRCWETDACAPLATDPTELEPIWRRLADRAAALGLRRETPATTTDAAPRLLLGGREIAPIEATASRAVFVLPAGASAATLVSRIGSSADHAPYLNDHRRLGLAVTRIVLHTGAEARDIPLDHPTLSLGWHPVERNGTDIWRWTDGRAELPLAAQPGPTVLELHLTGALTYRADNPASECRAA